MSAFMQCFPEGFETRSATSQATTLMCVFEGRLEARIAHKSFICAPYDLLFVPAEVPISLRAVARCLVFSISDLALRERLGFANGSAT